MVFPSQSRSPTAMATKLLPSDWYAYWNTAGSSIWKSSIRHTGSPAQSTTEGAQRRPGPPQHGVAGVSPVAPGGNWPSSLKDRLAFLPILLSCSGASALERLSDSSSALGAVMVDAAGDDAVGDDVASDDPA